MSLFNRCCACKKIVWLGQGSALAGSVIHQTCHQKQISEWLKQQPEMRSAVAKELLEATLKLRRDTGLKV